MRDEEIQRYIKGNHEETERQVETERMIEKLEGIE